MPDYGSFQGSHAGYIAAGMGFYRRGSAHPGSEHQLSFSELDRTQHHPRVQLDTLE